MGRSSSAPSGDPRLGSRRLLRTVRKHAPHGISRRIEVKGLAALCIMASGTKNTMCRGAGPPGSLPKGGNDARPASQRGRFGANLTSNAAFFAFNLAVGLWYTPYLIHHLGTEAFGIVPLVTQVVGYLAVITLGLNATVGRFITLALERGETEAAQRYFNTSLFGTLVLACLLLLPIAWATLHTEILIRVPAGEVITSRCLFACVAAVFLVNAIRAPFGVSTFCLNRFDLRSILDLVERVLSVGVVVAFFSFSTPRVWHIGVGLLLAAGITSFGTICFWRRLTPQLRVVASHCSFGALRELVTSGSWISINTIGAILYVSIDLLVVNRMFGPEPAGRYAAVLQWSSLLRAMAAMIVGVFGPTMVYYYARSDIDGLIRYGQQAVKLTGLLMSLPIGLICGFSVPLLQTWLGPGFVDMAWLMSLMTIHLSVTIAVYPLFGIQAAANYVRAPAIVTIGMGMGNLALAVFLAGPMGWKLYGVAAAGAVTLAAKNLVFTPLYAAHILKRRLDSFLWEICPITLLTLGTVAVCKLLAAQWDVSGWYRLMTAGAAVSLVYAAVGYALILNAQERALAWSMLPSLVSRRNRGNA